MPMLHPRGLDFDPTFLHSTNGALFSPRPAFWDLETLMSSNMRGTIALAMAGGHCVYARAHGAHGHQWDESMIVITGTALSSESPGGRLDSDSEGDVRTYGRLIPSRQAL